MNNKDLFNPQYKKLRLPKNDTGKDKSKRNKVRPEIYRLVSAMIHKAAYEPPSECNPDNGAFF